MKMSLPIFSNLIDKLHSKLPRHRSNLQTRFIIGVLAPPFLVLLLLSVIVLWQLDKVVRNQAIDQFARSSNTTAAKLEREFAIRQTVLKRTGEELFTIKSDYQTNKTKLDSDRTSCSAYVKQKRSFQGAPNNVCDDFLPQFASEGVTQTAVEDGYVKKGQELIDSQVQQINDRLNSYKLFFPETLGLMVLDTSGKVVSSAFSGNLSDTDGSFNKIGQTALKQSVEGQIINTQNLRSAVFAYPISSGSVLAVYDLDNDGFIKNTWDSTPVNRHQSLAVILDADGNLAYPNLNIGDNFKSQNSNLRKTSHIDMAIKGVSNIVAGSEAGSSKWLVAVASPTNVVLAPVRDAQLAAIFVIGCLLVGFLWVGTYYIRRSIGSILGLVAGALIFASGRLDYKITLKDPAEEFNQLADTMNGMAERIARAEKEIDEKNKEFISVATHELRTPLTAIIGNLSMAYEDMGDKLDEAIKPFLAQAYSGTMRLRDLINDLLDVARLEGGRTEFKIVPVNTKAVIEGVIESLQVVAQEKPVTLTYNNTGVVNIMADEAHLRIILNNFVSNAIKYNRPSGSVTVSHTLKDDKLITSISDTGLGIPEDQKAHMFEKFFRVDNEDRKDIVGTGLGMYITKQYILAMGGVVQFESIHGKGTTFHFGLPIAANNVQAQPDASSVNEQPEQAGKAVVG